MSLHVRRLGAVLMAATLVLGAAACGGPSSKPSASDGGTGPITFIGSKDVAGQIKQLVDGWNKAHPDQKVTYVEYSSAASDAEHQQIAQEFAAKSSRLDVIYTNNVWVSEFAARKWISPLNKSDFPISDLLPATVSTGEFKGQLYAPPMNTDGGMLFYRKDLVPTPPTTFSQMASDCAKAKASMTKAGMNCYAGQYAQYDGLTVNFTEAVADAGGTVTDDAGNPTVNTPQAKAGLQALVDGFKQGLIPKEAITYMEEPGRIAFQKGQLMFLRNWSYVYALASKAGSDSTVQGKFAMAPLPGITGTGKSALGGWNLSVSSLSKHPKTATAFINYLLQEPQQKLNLTVAAAAPAWASLYDNPALQTQYPFLPTLKKSLETAVPLPKTTNWSGVSLAIQKAVYAALQGQMSVDAALSQMQGQMKAATAQQ